MPPIVMLPPILAALGLGAATGTLVLGIFGRMAMRGYALLQWQEPMFTPGGSLHVVFLGTCAGMGTGVLLWLGRRVFPGSALARGLLFWAGLLLLAAWVLSPLSVQRVEVFGPLVVLHGGLLWFLWRRYLVSRGHHEEHEDREDHEGLYSPG